jgi:hypothetical protein
MVINCEKCTLVYTLTGTEIRPCAEHAKDVRKAPMQAPNLSHGVPIPQRIERPPLETAPFTGQEFATKQTDWATLGKPEPLTPDGFAFGSRVRSLDDGEPRPTPGGPPLGEHLGGLGAKHAGDGAPLLDPRSQTERAAAAPLPRHEGEAYGGRAPDPAIPSQSPAPGPGGAIKGTPAPIPPTGTPTVKSDAVAALTDDRTRGDARAEAMAKQFDGPPFHSTRPFNPSGPDVIEGAPDPRPPPGTQPDGYADIGDRTVAKKTDDAKKDTEDLAGAFRVPITKTQPPKKDPSK